MDMSEVKRKYVIPGEIVAEGNYRPLANVLQIGGRLVATRVGMSEIGHEGVRVIPLTGPYIPRPDDMVIGTIVDYSTFNWEVDINSCFHGILPAQNVFGRDYNPARDDLTGKFGVGDLIAAKVFAFDRTRDPLLSVSGPGLGKIDRGEVIRISSTKVPRLIGKKGFMVKTVESGSGCKLAIGQNGLIVINGPPSGILLAVRAIRLIDLEAHTVDLTQKVQALMGLSMAKGEEIDKVD